MRKTTIPKSQTAICRVPAHHPRAKRSNSKQFDDRTVRGHPVRGITFLFKPLQSTAKLTGRVTIVCVDASPRPASFATLYSNLPSPSLCVFVRVPCGPNLVHLALWHQKKKHIYFSTRPPRSTLRIPPPPISPSARMPLFSATPSDSAVKTISAGSSGTRPAFGSCPQLLPVKPIEKGIK